MHSGKLNITCFGQSCGYEDEVAFCFEVHSNSDEKIECQTPGEKCCHGGNLWNFPAGRAEPKCGTLTITDISVTCNSTSGLADTKTMVNIFILIITNRIMHFIQSL